LKRPKLVWHWVSLGVFVPHQRSSYVLSWPPLICWRHFELNVRCVDEDTFEFELNVRCVDEGAAPCTVRQTAALRLILRSYNNSFLSVAHEREDQVLKSGRLRALRHVQYGNSGRLVSVKSYIPGRIKFEIPAELQPECCLARKVAAPSTVRQQRPIDLSQDKD
jgi:hypothetical protein